MSEPINVVQEEAPQEASAPKEQLKLYHVRFRDGLQPKAASSKLLDLVRGDAVMVQTDHGPEPAQVCGSGIELEPINLDKPPELLNIIRRSNNDEISRYQNLLQREDDARRYCQGLIHNLNLGMKLLQVERYFNGSKVIFYFSAETRVDFRDLVKSLVQEFRTRVEMRQIGVRHETQMLGGIGCCGRELCCGLFMKDFVPVSIKMAKEQDLPLNPTKISGVCNRLLCCLAHEYETYKALKKGMPKAGRVITVDDKQYKVNYCKTLNGTVSVTSVDDARDTRVLSREEWENGVSVVKGKTELEDWQSPVKSGPASSAPSVPSRPAAAGPRPSNKPPAGKQMRGSAQSARDKGSAQPARDGGGAQSPLDRGAAQSPRDGGSAQPTRDKDLMQSPRDKGHRPPQASGKKTSSKQSLAVKPDQGKPQGRKPEPRKDTEEKPMPGQPSRSSRRSKGRRKGKTP